MSDKLIAFDNEVDRDVAWRRWYKKAISSSIKQLRGALKTIQRFPDRIFSNAQASDPFPLRLPANDKMRVFLVAVANGCEKAGSRYNEGPALFINTLCKKDELPFSVGTNFPEFVHIVNHSVVDALFKCFDTTRDFIEYLERKEQELIRETNYLIKGEENLIGAYMLSSRGSTEFCIRSNDFLVADNQHIVEPTFWDVYLRSNLYSIRTDYQKPSYVIDRIIEHVATEYYENRLVIGQDKELSYHEEAFRLIASESRLGRQALSRALLDVIHEDATTFWCNVSNSHDVNGLIYVWLIYPEVPAEVSDEEMEKKLFSTLRKYMLVAQAKFRGATRIFGLCLPNARSPRRSIIFLLLDATYFDYTMKEYAEQLEKREGILTDLQQVEYRSLR
ncbi:MAG: hypothetical protein ACXV74_02630 [Methylobacter sp.]